MTANGSVIADLCFESVPYSGQYIKVGCLFYFRGASPTVKVRFDKDYPHEVHMPPTFIGKYLKDSPVVQKKFDEAPMVEGDLYCRVGGTKIKYGHIHSSQDGVGQTLYWIKMDASFSVLFGAFQHVDGFCLWLEGKCE